MISVVLGALLAILSGSISTTSIVGQVTDAAGATLPGVTITLQHTGRHGVLMTTVTDASGQFAFRGVTSGAYLVQAALQGFERQSSTTTARDGESVVVRLDLSLADPEDVLVDTCNPIIDEAKERHPLQEYRVFVRDSAGLPIPDARVVISSGKEVRSDPEGVARFAGRPNDSVRVSHDGFLTVSASVCWIGRDSTITMRSKPKVPHAKP